MTYKLKPNQLSEISRLMAVAKARTKQKGKTLPNLMKMRERNLKAFYRDISCSRHDIRLDDMDLEELVRWQFLAYLSRMEQRLTLTVRSIILSEYSIYQPDENMENLIDDINEAYFRKVIDLSGEPITPTEKVIIVALLGLDAISEDYSLRLDPQNQKYFKQAVDIAGKFLENTDTEQETGAFRDIWPQDVIGEDPVLARMRRLDRIQVHTEGLYKKVKGKHYLDLVDKGKLDENKLTFLLSKLFVIPLSYNQREELNKTVDNIQQYGLQLYETNPPFDALRIRNRIKYLIQSQV